jgi:chitinase
MKHTLLPVLICTLVAFSPLGRAECIGDIDASDRVDVNDLLAVISSWGDCPEGSECSADVNDSGRVDVNDLLAVISTWGPCPPEGIDQRVVAYYIEWGIYGRNYHPMDMPGEKITHVNYAFANISDDGRIAIGDPYAAIDRYYPGDTWEQPYRGTYNQLNNVFRAKYPHIQTLISVGGWTWSGRFSDIALTDASRSLFAESCVDFLRTYNFDGVDIDWEYPVCCGLPGNTYRPEDKANYTLLLAELRGQLDAAGTEDGRGYLLTIAAPAGYDKITNLEPDGIAKSCDWINVMCYDYHGSWDLSMTNHHSKLYPNPGDPGDANIATRYNGNYAINAFLDAGVPADELVMGVPFYGRAWAGVTEVDGDGGLFQPGSYVPSGTWDDWSSGDTGMNDYFQIEDFLASGQYTRYWDDACKVPWLYSASQYGGHFITYDDAESTQHKVDYVKDKGLGGIMFWEITGDRNETLLDVIKQLMD